LHHTSGRRIQIGGKRVYAHVIDRVRFDRALAAQAVDRGVELTTSSRLLSIERIDGGLRLIVRRHGVEVPVTTRLLIGADGAQSTVARWLGATPSQESLVGLSVEAKMTPERRDMVEVFVGRDVSPGFFAWMIPAAEGVVRIGVATNGGKKPVACLQELRDRFPQVFDGAEFGRYYGGVIPLSRIQAPYADNVLLVGDAAGQVKPTSGGGIYAGLKASAHCAEVAGQALERNDLSSRMLSRYGKAWDHDFKREFQLMGTLRRIFLGLSDDQMQRLLSLIERPSLLEMLGRHGDIDYPSSVIGRLLRGPALPLARRRVMSRTI
jgi:geranylgeranyl reductase family protein